MIQLQNRTPLTWHEYGPPPVVFACDRFPRIRIQWDPDRDRAAVLVWVPTEFDWHVVDHVGLAGEPVETVARRYFQSIADAIDADAGAPWKS